LLLFQFLLDVFYGRDRGCFFQIGNLWCSKPVFRCSVAAIGNRWNGLRTCVFRRSRYTFFFSASGEKLSANRRASFRCAIFTSASSTKSLWFLLDLYCKSH